MSSKQPSVFGRPIAFHRAFVTLTGQNGRLGITGALMLSQAIYWSERTNDEEGWFWKTAEEWEEETGMTYREQATARKRLRGFPFWQEKRKSSPARMYFRVDMEALYAEFGLQIRAKRETRFAQSAKQDSRKARNINKNTETTTETTADREPAANAAGRKRRTPKTSPPSRKKVSQHSKERLSEMVKAMGKTLGYAEPYPRAVWGRLAKRAKEALDAGLKPEDAEQADRWFRTSERHRWKKRGPATPEELLTAMTEWRGAVVSVGAEESEETLSPEEAVKRVEEEARRLRRLRKEDAP